MASWMGFERGGVRLACRDFGGDGPPVLLLHGLAGHSGEWQATADTLVPNYRVFALDQRGHGRSERHPDDVSREAFLADVSTVIAELDLAPVVLVGQSMGAITALLVAASHPELVHGLVVVEGSPDGPDDHDPAPDAAARIREWLVSWPVPFPSAEAAKGFFREQGLEPSAWTAGLERRPDGLWPAFDPTVMVDCIAAQASRNYWREWRAIRCPTLIVSGQHGHFPSGHGPSLVSQNPCATHVSIPDAGHDVHLDAPGPWIGALTSFLTRLDGSL